MKMDDEDRKRRPRIAGGGENLPLDILSVLSEWVSLLEGRGTVPGASAFFDPPCASLTSFAIGGELGGISACIANFEQSLSGESCSDDMSGLLTDYHATALEMILTTPLPLCVSFTVLRMHRR